MVSPLNTHAGFPSHKILHNFPLFSFSLIHAQHVSSPLSALHLLLTDLKYFRNFKSSWQSSLRNRLLPATPLFCSHTPQTCSSQLVLCSFTTKSSVGHLTFVSSNHPMHYWSSHKSDLPSYFHPVQLTTFLNYPQEVTVVRLGQTEKSEHWRRLWNSIKTSSFTIFLNTIKKWIKI